MVNLYAKDGAAKNILNWAFFVILKANKNKQLFFYSFLSLTNIPFCENKYIIVPILTKIEMN